MTRRRLGRRGRHVESQAKGTAVAGVLLPDAEQVRSRAYEVYCERCESGGAGDALTDWLAAERELSAGGNTSTLLEAEEEPARLR